LIFKTFLPTMTSDTQANHDLQSAAGRHIISTLPYQHLSTMFNTNKPMNRIPAVGCLVD
jgi:hypothetical protein